MKIAVAQNSPFEKTLEENLASVADFAASARGGGALLAVFPEMFLCGFNYRNIAEILANPNNDIIKELCKIAKNNAISLCGTIPFAESADAKPYNRLVYISEQGVLQCHYDKIHLFGLFKEEKHIAAGSSVKSTHTPYGRAGFAVCYDLRFPELFRKLVVDGAQIIIMPSGFPHPRKEHFEILTRARAIENQVYIVTANLAGLEKIGKTSVNYFGASAVIDPWGDYSAKAKDDAEDLIFADIDETLTNQIRAQIPVFKDRRPELY